MWRLGSRPPRVRPLHRIVSVSPGRNRDPRQLTADDRRTIGAIIWKIGGQAALPHPADDAKTAKNLHRSSGDVVALDVWRFSGAADFGHHDLNAARGQVHRRR